MPSLLPVVPPASRSVFAGRSSMSGLRVVDWTSGDRFIGVNDLTRQQIAECPVLAEIHALDATKYLAEFQGMPGLVKGVNSYGSGMLVFSENLKFYTRVCESRVSGNKIKFNHGSEEFKNERRECWEFCVKRVRIDIITAITRENAVSFPFTLLRPDDPKCPICYDDLSGNVIECDNNHQLCFGCFHLLPGVGGQKKCPCCNTQTYSSERIDKYNAMCGRIIKKEPYFYTSLTAGNSFKEYQYNEALFFGMLKQQAKSHHMDYFRNMLMSSLYNYYIKHPDAFSSYTFNILNQVNGNHRTYNPSTDDLNPVIIDFLNEVHTPEIYHDVAHTDIYMNGYDDIQFFRELEDVEGNIERLKEYPNGSQAILRREIYFRYKVKHSTPNELIEYMKNIFYRIITNRHKNTSIFNYIEREE